MTGKPQPASISALLKLGAEITSGQMEGARGFSTWQPAVRIEITSGQMEGARGQQVEKLILFFGALRDLLLDRQTCLLMKQHEIDRVSELLTTTYPFIDLLSSLSKKSDIYAIFNHIEALVQNIPAWVQDWTNPATTITARWLKLACSIVEFMQFVVINYADTGNVFAPGHPDHGKRMRIDNLISEGKYWQLQSSMRSAVFALGAGLRELHRNASLEHNEVADRVAFHLIALRVRWLDIQVKHDTSASKENRKIQHLLRAAEILSRRSRQFRIGDLSGIAMFALVALSRIDPHHQIELNAFKWGLWVILEKKPLPLSVVNILYRDGVDHIFADLTECLHGFDQEQLHRILAAFIVGLDSLRCEDMYAAFELMHRAPPILFACFPGIERALKHARDQLLEADLANHTDIAIRQRLLYLQSGYRLRDRGSRLPSIEDLQSLPEGLGIVFVFQMKQKTLVWLVVNGRSQRIIEIGSGFETAPQTASMGLRTRGSFVRRLDGSLEVANDGRPVFLEQGCQQVRAALEQCTTIRWIEVGACLSISPEDILGQDKLGVSVHSALSRIPELAEQPLEPASLVASAWWLPPAFDGPAGDSTIASLLFGKQVRDDRVVVNGERSVKLQEQEFVQFGGLAYAGLELVALHRAVETLGVRKPRAFRRAGPTNSDSRFAPGCGHYVGHGNFSKLKPLEGRLMALVTPPQTETPSSQSGWQLFFKRKPPVNQSASASVEAVRELSVRSVSTSLNHLARPFVWLGGCMVGRQTSDVAGDPTGFVQAFQDNGTNYLIAPVRKVDDLSASLLACVFYFFAFAEGGAKVSAETLLAKAKRYLMGDWMDDAAAAQWIIDCLCSPTPPDMGQEIKTPMDLAARIAVLSQYGVSLNVSNDKKTMSAVWSADQLGGWLIEPLCEDHSAASVKQRWHELNASAHSASTFSNAWKKLVTGFVQNWPSATPSNAMERLRDTLNAFVCFR